MSIKVRIEFLARELEIEQFNNYNLILPVKNRSYIEVSLWLVDWNRLLCTTISPTALRKCRVMFFKFLWDKFQTVVIVTVS